MLEWLPGALSYLPLCFSLWSRSSCECHCSFETDKQVLPILERQLDRCGPEQLAGKAPDPLPFSVATFAVGALVGSLITVCLHLVWAQVSSDRPDTVSASPAGSGSVLAIGGVVGPLTPSTRRSRV